ncbi:basic proline-rich protein-like [Pteropus medius]|uniref:basic proline-rich protein-like n=1 Tax=Pteropus vampyrus TaxID=132908 RepID=UPI00196B6938|nr:basic proline-rich protein-like [Pteropus giganteus]
MFRRQGHAVGAKGVARRTGAQVAALGSARAASAAEGAVRHRSQPGPDPARLRPPPALGGRRRCSTRQGREPGVPRAQRCGARAPESPGPPRGGEPPPEGRSPGAARLLSQCPTWARRRGSGSWARVGPPPACRSALPAARQPGLMRLPERRGRAANGELETPEARPPGPSAGSALASAGVSLQPGSPDVPSAATRGPRRRPPPCSDLPELPPAPELFPSHHSTILQVWPSSL